MIAGILKAVGGAILGSIVLIGVFVIMSATCQVVYGQTTVAPLIQEPATTLPEPINIRDYGSSSAVHIEDLRAARLKAAEEITQEDIDRHKGSVENALLERLMQIVLEDASKRREASEIARLSEIEAIRKRLAGN